MESLKAHVSELMKNQRHILEAIKYLDEKVKDIIEKTKDDKKDEVKDIIESQVMIDEIIVKNSDDIRFIKQIKEENAKSIKLLQTRIDKIDKIDNELTKKSMFDKENDEEVEKQRVVAGKTHDLKECKLCSKRFKKCNELESHIKNCHENYREFKCDQCEKTFVLEWRLKKHINLHTDDNVQRCHYFNNKKNCPFEELGCKFLHAPSDFCRLGLSCQRRLCPQRHLDKEKKSVIIDTKIDNTEEDLIDDIAEELSSFVTSTPKKPKNRCDKCPDQTQCIDCYCIEFTSSEEVKHKRNRVHFTDEEL